MFYILTIILSMIIIALVNIFLTLSNFELSILQIVIYVIKDTIAVISIDGLFATIIRLLPNKYFNINSKLTNVSKKEQQFYEKLHIRKWKDHVLELGCFTHFRKNKLAAPTDNEYIERFILESNYGVIIHIFCIFAGSLIIFIQPLRYALNFGVPIALVNAVLNALPIFVLRYNIPKLLFLHKRNALKEHTK